MSSGVLTISDLRRGGWDDKAIRAALDAGTLVRITRGWVALPTAASAVVRAVRKGGRLGCLSGCAHFGLWTPPPGEPHVIVDRGTKRSHPNWHPHYGPLPAEAVFPLTDCLAQVIRIRSRSGLRSTSLALAEWTFSSPSRSSSNATAARTTSTGKRTIGATWPPAPWAIRPFGSATGNCSTTGRTLRSISCACCGPASTSARHGHTDSP